VDSFDENDHFTKRIFEFLVKETAQRYRQANPTAQHSTRPRPHTIHHYLGEDGIMDGTSNGAGDSNDSTNTSTSTSSTNTSTSTNTTSTSTSTGTGSSTNANGPALRRSYNFHAQRPYLPHHISGFERETTRAPTIGGPPSDSSPMTSGAALRYLLSNQGFGPSGRRSRIQQRALSSDSFPFHQSQNQSQNQNQGQSQGLNPSQQSLISAMNVLTGSNPFTEGSTAQNRGSTTGSLAQETDPSNTSSSNAATTMRRSIRREDRPREFVFRPPSRTGDLSNSMENVPDSFRISTSSLIDSLDSAADDLFGSRPSLSDRMMTDQARHLQDYIRHAEEFRHQQRRHLFMQAFQRGRRRHPSMVGHQRQTTLGMPSTDPQQSQQQHQDPRYPSRDNGLMLVQPYPSSSSSSITGSNTVSESTANGVLSQTVPSLSTLSSHLSQEDRYREFAESTRRSRSAMRNALMEDLLSEDTQQVLLAGEISRRRRRRIFTRISSLMGSPDMASHNSSTIISQSQQDQQQQTQAHEGGEQLLGPSVAPAEETAAGSMDTADANAPQPTSVLSTSHQEASTVLPVPTLTVELAEGDAGDNTSEVGLGLNAEHGNHEDHDDHSHQSVTPTPPSPNPNRNPMPTFTDRRRSSINPADIEAVARELEANSQSAGMTRLGSRTLSSSIGGARSHFSFQALTPTSVPEESMPLGLESQSDPSVPRSSGQTLVDGSQPLPSPPQTELDTDGVSPVRSPAGMPLH